MRSDDASIAMAAEQLFARIKTFCGKSLSTTTVHNIQEIVRDHRRSCRLRGIDFPELVPLVMTKQGVIELVRRDLDDNSLAVIALNLTVKYSDINAPEIAAALAFAFPGRKLKMDAIRPPQSIIH